MFLLARAVTYSALFIGIVLIYVPARLLSWSGMARPTEMDVQQVAGMVVGAAGAGLFFLAVHLFVVWYEEPTLRRTFGQEYEAYCGQVGRWWPSARADEK